MHGLVSGMRPLILCVGVHPLGENRCMAERVGQSFGNYQLLRLLGQGAFAEVHRH